MTENRFDDFTRMLGRGSSRRTFLGGLIGAGLAAIRLESVFSAPAYQLPFASGETWYYTSGPHQNLDANGRPTGPRTGIDLAPSTSVLGSTNCPDCATNTANHSTNWVVACSDGFVHAVDRNKYGMIHIVDADGNEYGKTGIGYGHLINIPESIQQGSRVEVGDRLGQPACIGGSCGLHVHLFFFNYANGRTANVAADGKVLSGWTIRAGAPPRKGRLERGDGGGVVHASLDSTSAISWARADEGTTPIASHSPSQSPSSGGSADASNIDAQTGGQQEVCPSGFVRCPDGNCYRLSSDPDNCGACGRVCETDICVNGDCICPSGTTWCDDQGICTDLNSDPRNCKRCGNECPPGMECTSLGCVCSEGSILCGDACVDPNGNDDQNCGECGKRCSQLDGERCCGGVCVDSLNDSTNCGFCGTVCGAGETCFEGNCVVAATGSLLVRAVDVSSGAPVGDVFYRLYRASDNARIRELYDGVTTYYPGAEMDGSADGQVLFADLEPDQYLLEVAQIPLSSHVDDHGSHPVTVVGGETTELDLVFSDRSCGLVITVSGTDGQSLRPGFTCSIGVTPVGDTWSDFPGGFESGREVNASGVVTLPVGKDLGQDYPDRLRHALGAGSYEIYVLYSDNSGQARFLGPEQITVGPGEIGYISFYAVDSSVTDVNTVERRVSVDASPAAVLEPTDVPPDEVPATLTPTEQQSAPTEVPSTEVPHDEAPAAGATPT